MKLLEEREGLRSLIEDIRAMHFLPNSGSFARDLIYILCACFLQLVIIPSFSSGYFTFDILTPWLVITAIRQHAPAVTALTCVAALTIEMHGSAPAGMYLILYWIMINTMIQIRSTLSWRHSVPWVVSYFAAALWVHGGTALTLFLLRAPAEVDWQFLLEQLVKVVSAVVIGYLMCREWLSIDSEEPIPK